MAWLKRVRLEKRLSQKQVADAIGVTQAYYSMIEAGTRTPSVQIAKRIGCIFEFSWTKFFP
jgi:putative transcriptional regulator